MPPGKSAPALPSLDVLGRDLLRVSPGLRVLSIARPLICFTLYILFASQGWWLPAIAAVAGLMFITYVSTSHDLLHRTLGFSKTANEVWLAIIEILVLRSGHAFRTTHLQHHRHFPGDDDIEGKVARLSWWRALLHGVGNQRRLFAWSWHRAPNARAWMAAECACVTALIVTSALLWAVTPVPGVYVILVITSSWLYPLATVWIPHRAEGENALVQTIAVRGRWVPEIFLQHTYHLEHHLYPSVSSHRWPELARRLDPWLRKQGVIPVKLP
jgi:beta-carotene hydroxylase